MGVINLNSQYQWDVDGSYSGTQDLVLNRSLVYCRGYVHKLSGSGYWDGFGGSNGSAVLNPGVGTIWSNGGFNYDFRNGSSTGTWTYFSGSFWVQHAPDGTGYFNLSGYISLTDIGSGTTGTGNVALPRIPRGPRIKHAGQYKNSIAYVKHGGTYKIAIPFVKHGGLYKIGGG